MSKDSGYTSRLLGRRYTVLVEGYDGPELTGEKHLVHVVAPMHRRDHLYLFEEETRCEDEVDCPPVLTVDVLENVAENFIVKHYGREA